MNPEFSHLTDRISSLLMNPTSTFGDPSTQMGSNTVNPSERDTPRDLITSFHGSETSDKKKRKTMKKKTGFLNQNEPQEIIWQLPFGMCKFLEDIYGHYTDVSVISWPTFKEEIFKLMDQRLKDDWEIIGSPTNAIIPFEEYIILYFIRNSPQLRLAALKLLEFLASLKFYAERRKRAYICSLLCNLIRRKDHGIYDYYLQNYFLFAYSKMTYMKDHFYEEIEGGTFILFEKLNEFFSCVLEFLDSGRLAREVSVMQMRTQRVNEREGYADVDDILFSCVTLFLEVGIIKHKEYNRRIDGTKKNLRLHVSKKGKDLSFNDFNEIVLKDNNQHTSLKSLSFGSDLTRSRAYILYCNLYHDRKRVLMFVTSLDSRRLF